MSVHLVSLPAFRMGGTLETRKIRICFILRNLESESIIPFVSFSDATKLAIGLCSLGLDQRFSTSKRQFALKGALGHDRVVSVVAAGENQELC